MSLPIDATVDPVDNIGKVAESDENEEVRGLPVAKGEIVAVIEVDECAACLSCGEKVTTINDVAGQCGKCNLEGKAWQILPLS